MENRPMKTFNEIFYETKLGKEVIKRELDDDYAQRQLANRDDIRKMFIQMQNKTLQSTINKL
jgi:hypothetical protein